MGKKRKVHEYGNSFAVVLDKQVCRLFEIDHTTELEMAVIDDRITFRPIVDRARRDRERTNQPDRFQLAKLVKVLATKYKLSSDDFQRLSNDGMRWAMFVKVVSVSRWVDAVTVKRLVHCLDRLRDLEEAGTTEPWAITIDAALLAFPPAIAATSPEQTASAAKYGTST